MERAVLIDIIDPSTEKKESELRLYELDSLVKTYGGVSVLKTIQKRNDPDYKTYVGKGKIQDVLDEMGGAKNIDVIIVNNILKPRQIYNIEEYCIKYQIQEREARIEAMELDDELGEEFEEDINRHEEESLKHYSKKGRRKQKQQEQIQDKKNRNKIRFDVPEKVKVWDRVDLILKIFDKHAKTAEAKLQIELASIKHMGPRIFGMGLELSKQAGGIGTVGAGETNTEIMKRHLQKRTKIVEEKIKGYGKTHQRHRDKRRSNATKTVALAGYTNAGKSTLIRALTKKKEVYVADALFATLDSKVGELYLPSPDPCKPGTSVLLADTIGFIQDLPPDLIQAFKTTLMEIVDADLILHVIDVSDKNIHKKIQVVEEILAELLEGKDTPIIYVFNKLDMLEQRIAAGEITEQGAKVIQGKLRGKYQDFEPIFLSAQKKLNLTELLTVVEKASVNVSP